MVAAQVPVPIADEYAIAVGIGQRAGLQVGIDREMGPMQEDRVDSTELVLDDGDRTARWASKMSSAFIPQLIEGGGIDEGVVAIRADYSADVRLLQPVNNTLLLVQDLFHLCDCRADVGDDWVRRSREVDRVASAAGGRDVDLARRIEVEVVVTPSIDDVERIDCRRVDVPVIARRADRRCRRRCRPSR